LKQTPESSDLEIDIEALEQKYAEERQKRLRSDGLDQYAPLEGKFADFAKDPHADPTLKRDPVAEEVDVAIIGGGFSGLLVGCRLRQAGTEDIRIIEKGADFGGTWYWNRYPGAACDVESYIYMPLLEELGYIPTEKYARAAEIHDHCRRIGERFGLYEKTLFQTTVTEAVWDENRCRWIVRTDRGDVLAARFLVSCIGVLSTPKLPGIPGIAGFSGHAFHTSRWDYAYTGGNASGGMTGLEDKVVGIIGTGATGIQCTPYLARSAKHLFVVQRTPSSIDARGNRPTDPDWVQELKPGWSQERRDNFTAVTSGANATRDLVNDGWTTLFQTLMGTGADAAATPPTPDALRLAEMRKMEETRQKIDSIVKDQSTAAALKPYYHYMCKRPGFSDDYLNTFNRDNVTLLDTAGRGVERITAKGIVVNGEEYPLDCLIFATGFAFMTDFTKEAGFDIIGEGGQPLSRHWAEGARTLYGMQTHGFPNFMLISYVQSGASINYVHIADEQALHIAHIVTTCLDRGIAAIQPTEQAEAGWVNEVLESSAQRRAFLETCTPGIYNFEGKRGRAQQLNDLYNGNPMDYLARLREWREAGALQGLEIR